MTLGTDMTLFFKALSGHILMCSLCTVYTRRIFLIQLVECSFRLNGLLLKLENQGYVNITYMVVNNQEERSQRLHHLLKERLPESITLYGQDTNQPDIWQAVNAKKDDILIYDRFGTSSSFFNLINPQYNNFIKY